jgi:hypothetical protein
MARAFILRHKGVIQIVLQLTGILEYLNMGHKKEPTFFDFQWPLVFITDPCATPTILLIHSSMIPFLD